LAVSKAGRNSLNQVACDYLLSGKPRKPGGDRMAAAARAVAEGLLMAATFERDQAGIAARTAGYQRRADEWMLQANLAARDLMQIGEQVIAALIQEHIPLRRAFVRTRSLQNSRALSLLLWTDFAGLALRT
jgi:hypothetical protein